MKLVKYVMIASLSLVLVGCSFADEYTANFFQDAEEVLEDMHEADEGEYASEIDPKVHTDNSIGEEEQSDKERQEPVAEEGFCLGEMGTCEEVGNRYLEELGLYASSILEGPVSDGLTKRQFYEPIVSYLVDGEQIVDPIPETDDTAYDTFIENTAEHERIWEQINAVIPKDKRDMLEVLIFYTDGKMNELASVEPTEYDPTKWMLNIDIKDVDDPYIFINTIVHEYGHLVTLNDSQIDTIEDTYLATNNPDQYEALQSSCPTYFTDFGCARQGSYLHDFYEQFWQGEIEDEWLTLDPFNEWEVYDFFERYYDEFLHDYAATSIYEDITESWTFFVFSEKLYYPTEVWEEKVNFFYQYPELVQLRAEILKNVAELLST